MLPDCSFDLSRSEELRLDCDPMEHLLVINLEGDRGKSRRDHVAWHLT